MSTNPTKNYAFSRPDFNVPSWHDDVNDNFTKADTLLKIAGVPAGVLGWEPGLVITAGDELYDSVTSDFYTALVSYTTGAVSFAADRIAFPNNWVLSDHTFRIRGEWLPLTQYNAGDIVTAQSEYIVAFCKVQHTSGTNIRNDPTKWTYIVDMKAVVTLATEAMEAAVGSGIEATLAEIRQGISAHYLSIRRAHGAGAPVALTYAAAQAWDMAQGINFDLVLTGNVTTLANPSNPIIGKSGLLRIKQDATGGRTIAAYGNQYVWIGGIPIISSAPNAITLVSYLVWETGLIYLQYGGQT